MIKGMVTSSSFHIEDSETSGFLNSHDPLDAFMFTLRAKETIRQYPKRLKIFFDSWNQSHETDIIKKFQIALNKAYLEAQEPRNKRIE